MISPKFKIQQLAIKQVLGYLRKDPEKNEHWYKGNFKLFSNYLKERYLYDKSKI